MNERSAWAAKFIGIPYKERGRDADGLDCWGLARAVQAEVFGVSLPSFADQRDERVGDWNRLAAVVDVQPTTWRRIPDGGEQPGDLVLIRRWGYPAHVGVVIAPGDMLHATVGLGVCVERYRETKWRHKVEGFWRPTIGQEPQPEVAIANQASGASAGLVSVAAIADPLSWARDVIELPAGLTLAEILAEVITEPWLREYACVALEGHLIPPAQFSHVRPKPGRRVTITVVPRGGGGGSSGGGKNTLATVLSVVVILAATIGTAWAGGVGGVGAALGATGLWAAPVGALAVASASAAALLAINALLPPPRPSVR